MVVAEHPKQEPVRASKVKLISTFVFDVVLKLWLKPGIAIGMSQFRLISVVFCNRTVLLYNKLVGFTQVGTVLPFVCSTCPGEPWFPFTTNAPVPFTLNLSLNTPAWSYPKAISAFELSV